MLNEHSANFHLSAVKIVDVVKLLLFILKQLIFTPKLTKNLNNYFFCMQLFQNWTI